MISTSERASADLISTLRSSAAESSTAFAWASDQSSREAIGFEPLVQRLGDLFISVAVTDKRTISVRARLPLF
jgi:hypothetical protein